MMSPLRCFAASPLLLATAMLLGCAEPALPNVPRAAAERSAIEPAVDALARRLGSEDARGTADQWELLARSFAALGRFDEADRAFAKANSLVGGSARLLADQAEVVLAAAGPGAAERGAALARQALALEPLQHKAMALVFSRDPDPVAAGRR
jgi:cytochrome c-type biogenesis protein CcmH